MIQKVLLLTSLLFSSVFTHAAMPQKLGADLDAGIYLPLNEKTCRLFGDNWFTVGAKLASKCPGNFPKIVPDFDYISRSNNLYFNECNKITIVRAGLGLAMSFAGEKSKFRPYASIGLAPAYVHIKCWESHKNVRDSGFTLSGTAEVGVFINDRFRAFAKYQIYNEVCNLDLNGIALGISYRIL